MMLSTAPTAVVSRPLNCPASFSKCTHFADETSRSFYPRAGKTSPGASAAYLRVRAPSGSAGAEQLRPGDVLMEESGLGPGNSRADERQGKLPPFVFCRWFNRCIALWVVFFFWRRGWVSCCAFHGAQRLRLTSKAPEAWPPLRSLLRGRKSQRKRRTCSPRSLPAAEENRTCVRFSVIENTCTLLRGRKTHGSGCRKGGLAGTPRRPGDAGR